jgi:hypothetical protein
MREIRPSGSEGGVADNGHPFPYRRSGPPARCVLGVGCRVALEVCCSPEGRARLLKAPRSEGAARRFVPI